MNYKRLAALFLTVTSLSAQAEQRWFEIELLLFQRHVNIQNIEEKLSLEQMVVDTSSSMNILKAQQSAQCLIGGTCLSVENPVVISGAEFETRGNNFQRLNSSQLRLSAQRKRLENHANFKPMLHMAWRMPVVSEQKAQALHIFAGENVALMMNNNNLSALTDNNNNLAAWPDNINDLSPLTYDNDLSALADDNNDLAPLADKWEIDGNFKIYLDHFLFIDSQLTIRKVISEIVPQAPQAVELINENNGVQIAKQIDNTQDSYLTNTITRQAVVKEFIFDQRRHLRSEEIHYLDHPLMGIIVQIRKIPSTDK